MSDPEHALALEYFKALRSEIDLRIKNQSYYTISKIVASGALLGQLANRPEWTLLSVPVVAILLDFVIHHNLATINAIGRHIRDEIEGKALSKAAGGRWTMWETSAGQSTGARTRDLLDRFGQLGVTCSLFALALLLYAEKQPLWGLPLLPTLFVAALLVLDIFVGLRARSSGRSGRAKADNSLTTRWSRRRRH